MSRIFLDTNVVVYAVSRHDYRRSTAAAILAAGAVINVQVLNEFVRVAFGKLGLSWPLIHAHLTNVVASCGHPRPLTWPTHQQAILIAERDKLRIFDANIVASALEAGCTELLTEDLQDGRVFEGRLTVRNPFV